MKTVHFDMRMSPEDYECIKKRMEAVGARNMSAYIIQMARDGYIIQMDLSDLKELLRLMQINSNNLNQYAKKANQTGSIYLEDVKDLQKSQKEIYERLGQLIDRLSEI